AHIYALGYLGLMAVDAGDLPRAEELIRDGEQEVKRTVSDAHFVAMFPALARARLSAARGNYVAALPAARAAIELAARGAGRAEVCAALLTAAMINRGCAPSADAAQNGIGWLTRARALIKQ